MNINSYNGLLNIDYKNNRLIITMIIIMILSLGLSYFIKSYDTYTTYATYSNNQLLINMPIENSDSVNKGLFIILNNQKYDYKINKASNLLELNNVNYQQYYLNIENMYLKENQVIKITLYYNKERITKKIIKKIF